MDLHTEKTGTLMNQLAHHYTEMNQLIRLVELDKLEFYLKGKGIPYERIDRWDDPLSASTRGRLRVGRYMSQGKLWI